MSQGDAHQCHAFAEVGLAAGGWGDGDAPPPPHV